MKILPPGSTIGILGGGQLGRMTAIAAAQLGYHAHIFCQHEDEPAVEVSAAHTIASFDDVEALTRFAKAVDVVTIEWENVPTAALEIIGLQTDVFPGPDVLHKAQDRGLEKGAARAAGIGTADYAVVASAEELENVLPRFARPCLLKSTRMGYDGKGQVTITPALSAQDAWAQMGSDEGIVEAFVDFACEVSVIVARREDGVSAAFPPVRNVHRDHILFETYAPAEIDENVAVEAKKIALTLTEKLGVVGLLAVEMFVLKQPNEKGQRVLVNEVAPRPHNSGHWTIDACGCSQYQQLVRAVCGLPLGDPTPLCKAVMRNLLGDEVNDAMGYLNDPTACVHLYGKKEARKGRKMGHVTFRRKE